MATNIFRDLDKEINKYNRSKLLQKHYKLLLGLFFSIIIGIIFFLWYQDHRKNIILEGGGKFFKAALEIQSGKVDDGFKSLEQLINHDSIYGSLASLNVAGIVLSKGDYNYAITIYDKLSKNRAQGDAFRDYAMLMAISSKLEHNKITKDEALKLLKEYSSQSGIFSNYGNLLRASILIDTKQKNEAKAILDNIVSNNPSNHLKILSELLMSNIY